MPKKPKLVTCSRCHRTIPAEEYTSHLSSHKKGKKIINPSINKSTKLPNFQQITQFPGTQEMFNARAASKPILSNLSNDEITEKFLKSLKDVDAQYLSLKIEQVENALISEVVLDEKRNLTLRYNPLSLKALSEQGIDGLLLHEACHVATLPHTNIILPVMKDTAMVQFIGNHITNYDEYLAHTEFVKRFRNDPRYEGLKEQHLGLFENYDLIVGLIQGHAEKFGQNTFFTLEQLGGLIYDSLFFLVAKDNSFADWAEKRKVENLALFTKWIYEDFELIRVLYLPFKETRQMVMSSAVLSMSVNPLAIFFNKIEFASETKKLHQDWQQKKNTDSRLLELWEQRRLIYQPQ